MATRYRALKPAGSVDQSLPEEVNYIIEESRMVLPGIQALFGFQLIAVFNQRFVEALGPTARLVHLGALLLVTCAIALIMAPAAYHRQAERGFVSPFFSQYASSLITAAMLPLTVALALEVGVVTQAVLANTMMSVITAGLAGSVIVGLWFVFPRSRRSSAAAPRDVRH